jgi:hypothetical protein
MKPGMTMERLRRIGPRFRGDDSNYFSNVPTTST